MADKEKILVVEDNENFRMAAIKYLHTTAKVDLEPAMDYESATRNLSTGKFTGAIFDVFMPEKRDSGQTDLGKTLIERMALEDTEEVRIRQGLEELGKYVDLKDPDMHKYARSMVAASDINILNNSIFRAIKQISGLGIHKAGATQIAKNTLQYLHRDRPNRDYYGALLEALGKSEANQPLGILLAEAAEKTRVPFVLATSTYHHDILTQPVQNYASHRSWRLVDCNAGSEHEKATPEFWAKVYGALQQKMRA